MERDREKMRERRRNEGRRGLVDKEDAHRKVEE